MKCPRNLSSLYALDPAEHALMWILEDDMQMIWKSRMLGHFGKQFPHWDC